MAMIMEPDRLGDMVASKKGTKPSNSVFSMPGAEVGIRKSVLALCGSIYGSMSVIALSFSFVLRR